MPPLPSVVTVNSNYSIAWFIRNATAQLRGSADRSWPSGRTTFPAVATPALPDEPPDDDDHVREGHPEVDDLSPTLRAPHKLFVGVVPGTRPLHYPALRCPKRGGLALLWEISEMSPRSSRRSRVALESYPRSRCTLATSGSPPTDSEACLRVGTKSGESWLLWRDH